MNSVMEEYRKDIETEMLFSLVSENVLSPATAAKKLGVTVEQLLSEMRQNGYKLPTSPVES